jgi:hypothetical protein
MVWEKLLCRCLLNARHGTTNSGCWAEQDRGGERGKYVVAALTIVRAYMQRKDGWKPPTPIKNYDPWCAIVRDPLIWLGYADPCETMEQIRKTDRALETRKAIAQYWHAMGAQLMSRFTPCPLQPEPAPPSGATVRFPTIMPSVGVAATPSRSATTAPVMGRLTGLPPRKCPLNFEHVSVLLVVAEPLDKAASRDGFTCSDAARHLLCRTEALPTMIEKRRIRNSGSVATFGGKPQSRPSRRAGVSDARGRVPDRQLSCHQWHHKGPLPRRLNTMKAL